MRAECAFDLQAIDDFGPVQPLGELRTIIGQRGRSVLPSVARIAAGFCLICSTPMSSVAAIASCISAGS